MDEGLLQKILGDKYEVKGTIKSNSSFATVFSAIDKKRREEVAIKVGESFDKDTIDHFKEEWSLLSRRRGHPHIVTTYEQMEIDRYPAIVMEKADLNLKDYVDDPEVRDSIDRDFIVNVMEQIGSGVSAIHDLGTFHRDLKPANMLVFKREGVIFKVADLGSAGGTGTTGPHGTLYYREPDCIITTKKGKAKYAIESDTYSLGVLMYAIITGSTPFSEISIGNQFELKSKKKDTDFLEKKLAELKIDDSEVIGVVRKCLAPERKDRYHSVDAILSDLKARKITVTTPPAAPAIDKSVYREFEKMYSGLVSLVAKNENYDSLTGLTAPRTISGILGKQQELHEYIKSKGIADEEEIKRKLGGIDKNIIVRKEKDKTTITSTLFPYGVGEKHLDENCTHFDNKKPYGRQWKKGVETCAEVCHNWRI